MNGTISVQSEIGRGSRFTVNIPTEVLVSGNAVISGRVSVKRAEYCANVLIIDEDYESIKQLTSYLNELNFYVVSSSSCLDGFRVAQNNNVDIIVLDIESSGMEGWLVVKTLKNDMATKNINIILSSSHDEHDLTNYVGADAYITKPYTKEIIEEILCNIVGDSDTVISL
jgi:CheY-like chemotaxis protein